MADLPANANAATTQNTNKQDNKFDKLTPILEYSYIVLYNMLNTLRSMKNYVDIYAQDMRLTDLEQYDKASVTLEKAIEDLTKAGKNIGAIYGLPEEMLDPQKIAQELAKQMERQAPKAGSSAQATNTTTAVSTPTPSTTTTPATLTSSHTPNASSTSTSAVNAQVPSATTSAPKTPAHTVTSPSSNPAPAATTPASTTTSTTSAPNTTTANNASNEKSSAGDNEEIQKILEQLKALRQNQ